MKKILIVEDQLDVLELLGKVLQAADREILLAENGEKALEIAQRTNPDVILLDVMLPGGIDGYCVTRKLKSHPSTANSIIIIMTAKAQDQDKIEAFEAGADDFIGKPYSLQDLKSKVARSLE